MPTFNNVGLRTAGAAIAAATLTLAAAAPAAAQTDYESVRAWFNLSDTNEQAGTLEYAGQRAYLAVEGPDASLGDVVELWVDFTAAPGVVELVPEYESRCEFNGDVLSCFDDGTDDLAGTFFRVALYLGEHGEPGDVAPYTVKALVNNTDEDTWSGEIAVSEDYDYDHELPEEPEGPDGPRDGGRYSYLDHLVHGSTVGATVNAAPQVLVTEPAGDYRVGSLIEFTDAIDIAMWSDPDTWYPGYDMDTDTASVLDEYDNCDKWEVSLFCAVVDWTPQAGTTYQPSLDTPVRYDIDAEAGDGQLAVYKVSDLSEAALEYYLEEFDIDLDGPKQFSMSESTDPASADDFTAGEGRITFSTAVEAVPSTPGKPLPVTGNPSIILISSSAAALLAGAVVFLLLRRRKTAATWE